MKKLSLFLTILACVFSLVACSSNDVKNFQAILEGRQEVPQVNTNASGEASVKLNTKNKTIMVDGTVRDLSSEIIMAHIHKGAVGENGNIIFTLTFNTGNDATKKSAKLSGDFSVTDTEVIDLQADNWYINVHSQDNPSGEVRGQIKLQ